MSFLLSVTTNVRQQDLLAYWVVKAYDPSIDVFIDVFKSYGQNTANTKVIEYLKKGVCAVVEYRRLPLI